MATPEWVKKQETYYQCSVCSETCYRGYGQAHIEPPAIKHECQLGVSLRSSDVPTTVSRFAAYIFKNVRPPVLDYLREQLSPEAEAAWRLTQQPKDPNA